MAKKFEVLEQIEFYEKTFRHPDRAKFHESELYDLYPGIETVHETKKSWPEQWDHSGRAGIYLFLDENLEVVYIGKSNHFGSRFGSYFGFDTDKSCKTKYTWKTIPRFVITIAVPDDSKFESSALEEFLLSKFLTSDNTLFNNRI